MRARGTTSRSRCWRCGGRTTVNTARDYALPSLKSSSVHCLAIRAGGHAGRGGDLFECRADEEADAGARDAARALNRFAPALRPCGARTLWTHSACMHPFVTESGRRRPTRPVVCRARTHSTGPARLSPRPLNAARFPSILAVATMIRASHRLGCDAVGQSAHTQASTFVIPSIGVGDERDHERIGRRVVGGAKFGGTRR